MQHTEVTQWCQYQRAGSLTPATIKLRAYHVSRALKTIGKPPAAVTQEDLTAYLAAQPWSPATRRAARQALSLIFHWREQTGNGPSPARALPAARVPRGVPHPAPDDAISGALAMASPRVRLMIELMAYGGLRRGEVATVKPSDVRGQWLTVTGKGGHTRVVPLPPLLAERVARPRRAWLFPGAINGHLSARRVGELVNEVLPAGYTAHSLRHRFATTVYSQTRDIRAVQSLLGHARLDTTMIYVAIANDQARAAAATAWKLTA